MPTYQYACSDCGHELEAVQSFSDDPLTECPECGGTLRKRFGNVGVVFKGSGFYRTDSRGKSSATSSEGSASSTSSEKSSGAGTSSGSTESSGSAGSSSSAASSTTSSSTSST